MFAPRVRAQLVLSIVLTSLGGPGVAWSQRALGSVEPLAAVPERGARRPAELIVRYRQNISPSQRAGARAKVGGNVIRNFGYLNVEQLRLQSVSIDEAIARLRGEAAVEYAEPNYVLQAFNTPNDTLFGRLYGMHNTGQTGGTPGADIHATQAWDLYTGDPELKVGVIDSGVDYTHPDLVGNIWTNPGEIPGNAIDDDGNGYVDDVHGYDFVNNDGDPFDDVGHGTHVSGTIAGFGNNGIGVAGVTWRARIIGIKFLDATGHGSTSGAIAAIGYALQVGARVTNNSWGGGSFSLALLDAIDLAGAAGQLFVAAAGNSASNNDIAPTYPASYNSPYILAVAATDHNDQLASFSNYGPTSVDLGAPGVDILSTVPGGGYFSTSGTSMATPHVTGAIAFMLGRFPRLTALQAMTLLLIHVDPVSALAGRVASGGRLNLFAAILEPDSIAPGAISDLRIIETGSSTMRLAWTATGDDGSTGRAARYDLRYSTAPITAANFSLAAQAAGPAPRSAGLPDSAGVSGLSFSTPYYFAIRAIDELANTGPISNVSAGTTLGAPDITVAPASLDQTLPSGASAMQTLSLRNDGQGTLDYTIPDPEVLFADRLVHEYLPLGKNATDPRPGTAAALGRGGPDPFGYRWMDSDAAAGPSFDWVDITGVGTIVGIAGDDVISSPIPIGMDFPFYGRTYSSLRVCTNGFVTFTGGNPAYSNQPLPNLGAPPSLIAPFWDDLIMPTPSVYSYSDGSRFIVSWIGLQGYAGGGTYTFQMILYPTGEVRYQYLTLQLLLNSQTVGIQNESRDTGLTIAFNAPYLHDRLAIRILQVSPWFQMTPRSGRLRSGEEAQLTVTFDANGLLAGDHLSELRVLSNDPDEATVLVPARLHVIGDPNISVLPTSLDFGEVFLGNSPTQQLVVTNNGTDVLAVSGITSGDAALTAVPSSFVLAPFASRQVAVRYSPTSVEALNTQLLIASDDPDQQSVGVLVTGAGVLPPDIAVVPVSLSTTVSIPGVATQTLTIQNTGHSALVWGIEVQGITTVGSVSPPGGNPPHPGEWGAEKRIPSTAAIVGSVTGPLATLPAVIQDPTGDGGPVDLITLGGRSRDGVLDLELDLATTLIPADFGGVVSLDIDQNRSTGTLPSGGLPMQDIGAEYEVTLFTLTTGTVSLYSTSGGYVASFVATFGPRSVRFGIPLHYLSDDDGQMDVTGVIGTAFVPTDWFPDAGHGTIGGASWLSLSPDSGVVAPGQSTTITAGYDTRLLVGGQYLATITIGSNDPDEAAVVVPVRLAAVGVPDLAAYPPSMDFGNLFVGQSREVSLILLNEGTDALVVSSANLTGAAFEIVEGSFPVGLGPGDSTTVRLRFSSDVVCTACPGHIDFASNDPDENPLVVPLVGAALAPPLIVVSPDSFAVSLLAGQTATRTLRIDNPGTGTLEWSISAQVEKDPSDLLTLPVPGEPLDPPAPGTQDNVAGEVPLALARATYPASGPGPRVLLYADAATALPGQQDSDRALQALGLGYTAFYGDAAGFGSALSGEQWDLVIVEHASRFELGQWWNEIEAYVQQGGHVLISTFDIDGSHSETTTLWSTLGVTPAGTLPTPLPVYWWDAQHPIFNDPESVPPFVSMQNYYTDPGDYIGSLPGATGPAGFTPVNTVGRGAIVIAPNRRAIVNSFIGSANFEDRDADGVRDAVELLVNEIEALSFVNWLTADPASGTLGPGQSVQLTLQFDATALVGGDYTSDLVVSSNAPTRPEVTMPARLHVTGVPDLVLEGSPRFVQSIVDYVGSGAQTSHHLVLPSTPSAAGVFELIADGDYGNSNESARLVVEGVTLGVVSATGSDCSQATGSFPVNATMLAAFVADGAIDAVVRNSLTVDDFCTVNRHAVRIGYLVGATSLEFGSAFTGVCRSESVSVRNRGTDVLHVTSIEVSSPAFTPFPASFSLGIGESRIIVVRFCPETPGVVDAMLTLHSDDPDTPSFAMDLHGTGHVPPDITVIPTQIVSSLDIPGSETRHVTIRNDGGSDLSFVLLPVHSAVSEGPVFSALELPRGALDPRPGILGNGGPDRFGYRWVDSDDPAGPSFDWVDITGVGTVVGVAGDDAISSPIAIRMNFPFYGRTYSSLRVCTNGFVTFTGVDASYSNQPLPNLGAPPSLIAPFWDDLIMPTPRAYTYFDGSRFIVSWVGVQHYGSGGPYSFEVILYPSGEIVYQYLSMATPTSDATVGIQNAEGDDGLTVAFNAPYLHDGLAVRFRSTPEWLTVTPTSAVVPAGQSADLQLAINTAGLVSGIYRSAVDIRSNDPDEPQISVTVSLSAAVLPDITVNPVALDFGRAYVGQQLELPLVIRNVGTGILSLSDAQITSGSSSGFRVGPGALPTTLNPGQSAPIKLRFMPTQMCSLCVGSLQIGSDDPDENPLSVPLRGWSVPAPVVGMSPDSMRLAAATSLGPTALHRTKTLTIRNTGGSELQFHVAAQAASGPIQAYEPLDLPRGAADPRAGLLGSGGPDQYGYRWRDSDEPSGPAFNWVDLTTVTAPLDLVGDDAITGPINLGVSFPYYGQEFGSAYICTNGFMTFTDPRTSYVNQPLPNRAAPANMLAPFWDDLIVARPSVYAHFDGSRFVVSWVGVRPYGGAGPYSFQVLLYPNGEIRFQYTNLHPPLNSATVGIQNATRIDGLMPTFNHDYLHDSLAVAFTYVPRWVSVDPAEGSLPPGASMELQVRIDATNLTAGDHFGSVEVASNDPLRPVAAVPCRLHVGVRTVGFDIEPNTLNAMSHGRWVKGQIEMPLGLDPHAMLTSTVLLQRAIPVAPDSPPHGGDGLTAGDGDADDDGMKELHYRFDRRSVTDLLPPGDSVPVEVIGEVADVTWIQGIDFVRALSSHPTPEPDSGDVYIAGASVPFQWTDPQGAQVTSRELWFTADEGDNWQLVASGVTAGNYIWTVPAQVTDRAMLGLVTMDAVGVMGTWLSDRFRIVAGTLAAEEARVPDRFGLRAMGASPARGDVALQLAIPTRADVELSVFDVRGRAVTRLGERAFEAGWHRFVWDARDHSGARIPPGIYFIRMIAGGKMFKLRLAILR